MSDRGITIWWIIYTIGIWLALNYKVPDSDKFLLTFVSVYIASGAILFSIALYYFAKFIDELFKRSP